MKARSGRPCIEAADLDDGRRSPEQKLCIAVLIFAGHELESLIRTKLDCYKFKNLKDPTSAIAGHRARIVELQTWFHSSSKGEHSLLWWAFLAGVNPQRAQRGLIENFQVKAPID